MAHWSKKGFQRDRLFNSSRDGTSAGTQVLVER